jgi:hypothetical protein
MSDLRSQFDIQLAKAQIAANFKGINLDLVMVKHKGRQTRISVLGNAISRAAYSCWKNQGSNVRLLRVVRPAR